MEDQPSTSPLALPKRSHPPPLFYLPAILTPAQEAFLEKRKIKVSLAFVVKQCNTLARTISSAFIVSCIGESNTNAGGPG
jgi:hypothetical protein